MLNSLQVYLCGYRARDSWGQGALRWGARKSPVTKGFHLLLIFLGWFCLFPKDNKKKTLRAGLMCNRKKDTPGPRALVLCFYNGQKSRLYLSKCVCLSAIVSNYPEGSNDWIIFKSWEVLSWKTSMINAEMFHPKARPRLDHSQFYLHVNTMFFICF